MIKLSSKSRGNIESGIRKVWAHYPADAERQTVTDIYFYPKADSGELIVCDDDDHELVQIFVEEWNEYDGDDFYETVACEIRPILSRLKGQGVFDQTGLMKPYSVILVNDDRETVAELMLVDDDTLLLDDELLKGLDEELDAFLKDLLEK